MKCPIERLEELEWERMNRFLKALIQSIENGHSGWTDGNLRLDIIKPTERKANETVYPTYSSQLSFDDLWHIDSRKLDA